MSLGVRVCVWGLLRPRRREASSRPLCDASCRWIRRSPYANLMGLAPNACSSRIGGFARAAQGHFVLLTAFASGLPPFSWVRVRYHAGRQVVH